METRMKLLSVLSEGGFRSGEALADQLGVSRTAVWKHIQGLAAWGLDIFAVRGKGYCLAHPIRLLEAEAILSQVRPTARGLIGRVHIFPVLDSTNRYLMDVARSGGSKGEVCFAERQEQGKGRRGREWISPFGCNLYLSILWRFPQAPSDIASLGLAVGIGVADAIKAVGATSVGLKWPNDIYWRDRKVGGILLEVYGEAGGPSTVIVGIGINVDMSQDRMSGYIDQPWSDVATAAGGRVPCRNQLGASVLTEAVTVLDRFEHSGFAPFIDRWNSLDTLMGREVDIRLPSMTVTGIAQGIDSTGALLVVCGDERRRFMSGELSVRVTRPPSDHT